MPLKRISAIPSRPAKTTTEKVCVTLQQAEIGARKRTLLIRSQLSNGSMVVDLISSIDNSAVTLCTFTSEISA